jgi:hypothetical protein
VQIRAARERAGRSRERLCGPGTRRPRAGRPGAAGCGAVPAETGARRCPDSTPGRVDHPVLAGRFGERDGGSHGASGPRAPHRPKASVTVDRSHQRGRHSPERNASIVQVAWSRGERADVADSHAGPTAVPQDAELTRARRRAVHRSGVPLGTWAVAGLAVTVGRNLRCVLPWPPQHAGYETHPAGCPAAQSHACDRLTGTSSRTERSWNQQGTRRRDDRLWTHRSAALVTCFPLLGLWQWRLRTVC